MTDMHRRLFKLLSEQLDKKLEYEIARLERYCESPIEVMLGAAFLVSDKLDPIPEYPLILACQGEEERFFGTDARLLIPQFKWKTYRIDWVFQDHDLRTFIECDGHDFHERTKEQAARDRRKDREIQQSGIPVLRFTGSEIFRDPLSCVDQIREFSSDRHIAAAMDNHPQ